MGTGVSLLACENEGCPSRPRLGDLPEDCVALVLSYLDPPEICKLAKLNRAFRGASRADLVWEPKLPSNYCLVIEKVFKDFPENLCKKEIYARLCQPNPFDGGTKVQVLFPFIFSCWALRKYKEKKKKRNIIILGFLSIWDFLLFSWVFPATEVGCVVSYLMMTNFRIWVFFCRRLGWIREQAVSVCQSLQRD